MNLIRCLAAALFVSSLVAVGCSDKKSDGSGIDPKTAGKDATSGVKDDPAPPVTGKKAVIKKE